MKLAYLSTYRDNTEMSAAAISNILACEAAGIDVVCRPISLSQSPPSIECSVEHLETKDLNGVDVVVQHVVPTFFEYVRGVKNVGCFGFDADNFNRSSWTRSCNLMDELWVPSYACRQAVLDSNVVVPVHVVPYSCNHEKFMNSPEPLDLPQLKNKCVFYFIGEVNRQNNLPALLRAYYAAFSSQDDVVLVIKAEIPGQSSSQIASMLKNMTMDIKKSSHVYVNNDMYPPVLSIADDLSQTQLDRLHVSCDFFVHPARGVSWGIEAYNAMGFGNPAILSLCGIYHNLVSNETGWAIPGQPSPCFGIADGPLDLYSGAESWFEPDLTIAIEAMRSAYSYHQDDLHFKGKNAKARIANTTPEAVGQIINNILKEENDGVGSIDNLARCQSST